ncbi:hypothetical protein CAPTEDRAFT_222168 [Capitella teleta]|uniref:Large ribosomal subunit protein mL44 n=1 Tax=Capitella teleta TaxID=283909 RepID=X2ASX5_CAPTE|nr:hypothetical protein CAPTEDRAFT_222168 [Capitella teleta]|eukprot:ELT88425.1 hypothetical protein CAPTEDRAFT_222168 [Capitella teleta]
MGSITAGIYSKYPEYCKLPKGDSSSETTIAELETIFGRFGIPVEVFVRDVLERRLQCLGFVLYGDQNGFVKCTEGELKYHLNLKFRDFSSQTGYEFHQYDKHCAQFECLCRNYDSEIYSFGKRLGEEFNENLLRTAFVDRSDVESADSNEELASTGSKLAVTYIKAYLRHAYPGLPEEGISTITEHLMSDQVLSYVASNLGVPDLIKAENWPFSEEVIANSFKAVIGALAESQNVSRAELFVQDLVLTQLIGRDLFELWDIVNPVGLIQSIFNKQGRGELEPRLLWEAGSDTVVSSYMVGFYENKKLIGKGFGESVPIAEEMAARDALRNVFGLKLNRPALPFGKEGRNLNLDLTKLNASMAQISSSPQQQLN